jgi:hypothetical protein
MAGAGYNIPISVSAAESFSMPTAFNAPSLVNFGTGANFRETGGNANASPVQPATATSATAQEGNAMASTQGSGVGTSSSQQTLTQTELLIWGGVISLGVAIAAAYLLRNH